MNSQKRFALMWWSICSLLVGNLLCIVWWAATGKTFSFHSIKMTPQWSIELPWTVPGIFYSFLGPIVVILLFGIFGNPKITGSLNRLVGWIIGAITFTASFLCFATMAGIFAGLVAATGITLVVILHYNVIMHIDKRFIPGIARIIRRIIVGLKMTFQA